MLQRFTILVAIAGGSGAGKSWLAGRLQRIFHGKAARISLDDFYLDRSHLSPARRAQINFDHPRSIDWPVFHRVLRDCLDSRETLIPRYDFKTHCRLSHWRILRPRRIILIDGLWLLYSPQVRKLFDLTIYLDCPVRTRLSRRLKRDLVSRGRTLVSVRQQFSKRVEPMHRIFVAPQRSHADVVLEGNWGEREVKRLAEALKRYRDNFQFSSKKPAWTTWRASRSNKA